MSAIHRTAAWRKLTSDLRPQIAASLPARCVQPRCQLGGVVHPGDAFDVGHRIDAAVLRAQGYTDHDLLDPALLGPAHRKCNRSDGGKAGARIANTRRERAQRQDRRMPKW